MRRKISTTTETTIARHMQHARARARGKLERTRNSYPAPACASFFRLGGKKERESMTTTIDPTRFRTRRTHHHRLYSSPVLTSANLSV